MSEIAPGPATHFLARVVASAQGLAPLIEPRLPSLFEPVAVQGDSGGLPAAVETQNTTPDLGPRRVDADVANRLAREPPLGSGDDDQASRNRNVRPDHLCADKRASLVPMQVSAAPPATAPISVEAGNPIVSPSISGRIDDDAPMSPPFEARAPVAPRSPVRIRGDARNGHGMSTLGRTEDSVPPAAAALVAKRLSLAALPAASHPGSGKIDAQHVHAAAQPDVHISIGRVEIRAHAPPPKPGPQPTRENAPTRLERYLARAEHGR